jgi:hypothetical protein
MKTARAVNPDWTGALNRRVTLKKLEGRAQHKQKRLG